MEKSDKSIFEYLSNPRTEEADAFLALVFHELHEIREDLIRLVESMKTGLKDIPNFIDDVTIESGLKLRAQFMGDDPGLKFDSARTLTLKDYVIVIIGQPHNKNRGGMITNALRKQKTYEDKLAELATFSDSFEAVSHESVDDPANIAIAWEEEKFVKTTLHHMVDDVLADLKNARNAFIFRLATGIHRYATITPDVIRSIAKDVGLDSSRANQIYTIAKTEVSPTNDTRHLAQITVAKIIGLKPASVRDVLSKVRGHIKTSIHNMDRTEMHAAWR